MASADLPRLTGDAAPYGGGDPYADYRAPGPSGFPFSHLPDLADRRLGAGVTAANDEFFAECANLLKPEPAHFAPEAFGPRGKIMDGWETRRRRATGNDWVRYRLTGQAVIRAVEIDETNYLKGKSAGWAALYGRDGERGDWGELLPRTRLQPDTVHRFLLADAPAVTHVRLDIFPDGGIARLRLHGALTGEGERRLTARYQELGG
ncbi:hypothetical protein [Streptomyces halobius]|uniref:Allantoicase domain-containing protein n=1 Tax=Streptomyces halobius TaxID=2879846 RepID=A0ABY4M3W7_9ACTN|nr:hypothetical protein [Streptomyces halobius]UQA92378.1 hypothetical protein K9S39_11495 [Streptomyces halobius]